MVTIKFSGWKRAIFCKVKEIKYLSGGVVLYAAQTNAQIDAEIAKKGRFRMKTRLESQSEMRKTKHEKSPLFIALPQASRRMILVWRREI